MVVYVLLFVRFLLFLFISIYWEDYQAQLFKFQSVVSIFFFLALKFESAYFTFALIQHIVYFLQTQ